MILLPQVSAVVIWASFAFVFSNACGFQWHHNLCMIYILHFSLDIFGTWKIWNIFYVIKSASTISYLMCTYLFTKFAEIFKSMAYYWTFRLFLTSCYCEINVVKIFVIKCLGNLLYFIRMRTMDELTKHKGFFNTLITSPISPRLAVLSGALLSFTLTNLHSDRKPQRQEMGWGRSSTNAVSVSPLSHTQALELGVAAVAGARHQH